MARKKAKAAPRADASAAPDVGGLAPDVTTEYPDPATRLFHLFRGLSRAYGSYNMLQKEAGQKKIEGKSVATVRGEVTVALWNDHLRGKSGLGIVPIRDDNTCVFGAIDIDKYDIRLEDVEAQCARLRLPLLPTRTKSGGVHLYAFTLEAVPAALIRRRLEEWAVALGFAGSEIFPKQNALASETDIGNWINMPYFNAVGAATERYGVFKGKPLTVDQYIERAEKLRVTHDQLQALELEEIPEFLEAPPCLQSLARRTFGAGERNKGLFAVGVYLKKRFPDDWQQHLINYNLKFMQPPLSEQEVKQTSKSLGRKDYGYTCNQAPIQKYCNRQLCHTREFGVGKGVEDWGLVIDADVQKICTDPPYWMVTINSERLMLTSEHFMQQRKFQELCTQRLNVLPPPLKADKWRETVQKILQTAVSIEAPHDASPKGELAYHLRQFCTVFPQAETREELVVGKPFTEDGFTMFRAADFKKYLVSQQFRALESTKLYAELRNLGVQHRQLWVKSSNQLVWAVREYPKEDAEIEVPVREDKKQQGAM